MSETKTTKAEREVKRAEEAKQRNQILAILLFALSIFMACLVLIEGDHVWPVSYTHLDVYKRQVSMLRTVSPLMV